MDGIHDMGGMQGFGAAVWPGSEAAIHHPWELRVFALNMLSQFQDLEGGPGFRLRIESMPADRYLESTYYERWLWRVEQDMLARGTIAPDQVEAWMDRLRAGEEPPRSSDPALVSKAIDELRRPYPIPPASNPRFAVGDRVRVRRMRPVGHTRCPRYVRGASGVIHRIAGEDRLPEGGDPGAREAVYGVSFSSTELWGPNEEPPWTVRIDLWESYLRREGDRGD